MAWINFKKELAKAVRRAGISREIYAAEIVRAAEEAVQEVFTKETAGEVKPLFYRNNTLTVQTTSSIVAQEVKLREYQLVNVINNKLGSREVRGVLVRH